MSSDAGKSDSAADQTFVSKARSPTAPGIAITRASTRLALPSHMTARSP